MPTYAEARGRPYWLLDLEVAGTVYRFASAAVSVIDAGGVSHQYREGLAEPAASLVQAGAAESSVALSVLSGVDWALIESQGHTLERARGILRRWWAGGVLERSRVYLRGLALDIQYGEKGEPLAFSLVRSPRLEADTLPDTQAVVDSSSWPVITFRPTPDKSIGVGIPIIVGCPGHDPAAANPHAAVPVPYVEYSGTVDGKIAVYMGPMHAAAVQLHNRTFGTTEQRTPFLTPDLLGRDVSVVTFGGGVQIGETDEFWIGLQDDATFGGGLASPVGPGPLRGAGDVISWALVEHSGMTIDAGRMAAAADWLNRFSVDSYLNAPTNVWDWLTAAVLSWLPVVPRESAAGLYFQPIRWDYTLTDVVAFLDVARDVQRAGPIGRLKQPIYNEITVRYRPSSESGKWHTSRTVTATAGTLSTTDTTTTDARVAGSFYAARSQAIHGVRPYVVDIAATWDDTTASLVAELLISRYAWPKRTVQYTGGRDLEALEPGQAVAITDPSVHLDEALAILVDIMPTAGGVRLDLILLDHPAG